MDERTYARYMSDVAYFLSRLEAEPDSYYFIPIALAYNKLEKYDETISVCRAGLERFPSHCQAKVLLAEAYVYKGETDLARDMLFDVLTDDVDNYKALKLLGIIYQAMEMPDEAVKYFKGAYLRSPEDTELKRIITDMGGSVDISDAIGNSSRQGETVQEDDEDAKTFFEIEQQIKNAELVMADLVADKTIMGPKRGGEDEEDDAESNLISDDELANLIAQAELPKIAPMKQDEIAPPDEVVIDDDLAKLMSSDGGSDDENEADGLIEALESGTDGLPDNENGDLASALLEASGENGGESGFDDGLASALLEASVESVEVNESGGADDDLISALTGGLDGAAELNEENAGVSDAFEHLPVLPEEPGGVPPENMSGFSDRSDITPGEEGEPLLEHVVAIADMIPDDDFYMENSGGLSCEDNTAASFPQAEAKFSGLGESAPFVQTGILDEIFSASGIEAGAGADEITTGPDTEANTDTEEKKKERQLKKLEATLDTLRKRTEK